MNSVDYSRLELKIGLEVHVQLDTRKKLFCSCPTKLSDISQEKFTRYLRPARSETGEVDPAALVEWKKNKLYLYSAPRETSCLVEADEEPPHELDEEALTIAIAIAKALNMKLVDEVHVMRKIVIDGSNVCGFQRTALIAMGGYIEVENKRIGIQTLCLEEDAARKLEEKELEVNYSIDRLGIPLVEIATAPDCNTPDLALKTALKIGQLTRLTKKTKRGLGTIRQDLNISIKGGAKVEIKGIQYLHMIPRIVENEVERQLKLLEIRDELQKRGVKPEDIKLEFIDVTRIFEKTESKLIKKALSKNNTCILVLKLPGFKGLLGRQLQPGRRFGTELSDYAKVWGGVGGIIHTDELPSYGITLEEVMKVYSEIGADPDRDAIVLVVDERNKAENALRAVAERAIYAIIGVPEETRAANPDGTTKYMRPRPGAARMYPETDIPPVPITQELLVKAAPLIPEHPDIKYKKLIEKHGLSKDLASTILNDLKLDLYEYLAEKYGDKVPCTIIASIFVNTIPALRREGIPIDDLSEEYIEEVVKAIAEGFVAKEAIPDILTYLAKNPGTSVSKAIDDLGLKKLKLEDLDSLIIKTIIENEERILSKKEKAFTIVMSEVMKTTRGKIDGKIVAERVKTKLRELLNIDI